MSAPVPDQLLDGGRSRVVRCQLPSMRLRGRSIVW